MLGGPAEVAAAWLTGVLGGEPILLKKDYQGIVKQTLTYFR